MATRQQKLDALMNESRVLVNKKTLDPPEIQRLNQILAQAKGLNADILQEQEIDRATGGISDAVRGTRTASTEPTEDGFQAGIGGLSGKAMFKAITAARANTKAVVQSGSLVVPADRDPEFYNDPMQSQFLTSLIPTKLVESNDISYLVQTIRDSNAAVVPDSTQKPTSTFTLKEVTGTLDTVAHLSEYAPLRLFEDAAMLSGWLYSEMENGLRVAEEAEALATIIANTDTQSQAFDTDVFRTVRKAISKLQRVFVSPDVLVLSITDSEAMDLETDGIGRYFYQGPKNAGSSPAWSVPVTVSPALDTGIAILASAAGGIRRYVRGQGQFDLDNISHFDTNEVRSRLERRSLTTLPRPFEVVIIDTGQTGS